MPFFEFTLRVTIEAQDEETAQGIAESMMTRAEGYSIEGKAAQHRVQPDVCQTCGSTLSSGTTKKDGTQSCPVCGTRR